jgi:hypothetical protein
MHFLIGLAVGIVLCIGVIAYSGLMPTLIRKKAEDNPPTFSVHEMIRAQLDGEEKGLLLAFGILHESAKEYEAKTGFTALMDEKFQKEISMVQYLQGTRKKVI